MKKWSLGYAILKLPIGLWHYLFYKKVTVINRHNIPTTGAVVFAPNHQNALMDALAVIFTCRMQPVFLARADIFSNPTIAAILRYIRILPVYRIRDGADNLSKNEEVFEDSVKVLELGKAFAVFPEATHNGFRYLRKLKKGIPRIVFQAEETNNYSLPIKIIPVGIYYSNYEKMKSTIIVNYGEPIEVLDFVKQYKENNQKGMAALRQEMEDRIKPLMIHINDRDNYDFYELSRELFDYEMIKSHNLKNNPKNKLQADQEIIRLLEKHHNEKPDLFIKLKEKVDNYFDSLHNFGLKDYLFDTLPISYIKAILYTVYFILTLPFQLYGFLLNYPAYKFLIIYVPSIIKDKQFRSSLVFGIGLILFPVWFILLTFILSFFVDGSIYCWLFLFSIPITGLFALNNWARFKDYLLNLKYIKLKEKGSDDFEKITNNRKEIIEEFRKIVYNTDFS